MLEKAIGELIWIGQCGLEMQVRVGLDVCPRTRVGFFSTSFSPFREDRRGCLRSERPTGAKEIRGGRICWEKILAGRGAP